MKTKVKIMLAIPRRKITYNCMSSMFIKIRKKLNLYHKTISVL